MEALDLTILAAAGMAYAVLSARLGPRSSPPRSSSSAPGSARRRGAWMVQRSTSGASLRLIAETTSHSCSSPMRRASTSGS